MEIIDYAAEGGDEMIMEDNGCLPEGGSWVPSPQPKSWFRGQPKTGWGEATEKDSGGGGGGGGGWGPVAGGWFKNAPMKIKRGRRHSVFNAPEAGVADGRVFWDPQKESTRVDRRQSVSRPKTVPLPTKRRRPPPGFLAIPSPYMDIPARKFPQGRPGTAARSSTFVHSPVFKDFMAGTRQCSGASPGNDKLEGSPEARKYYRSGPRRGSIPCPLKAEGKKAYGQGRFRQAIQMYSEHLAQRPDDLSAMLARSKAYSAARDYNNALRDVKMLLAQTPKSFHGHLQLGAVLRDQRKLLGALNAYKGALKILPPGLLGLQWKETITKILDKVHNSFYSGRISSSIPFREELLGQDKIDEITKMNSVLRRAPIMMPVVDPRASP